jgi:hypothetical protein
MARLPNVDGPSVTGTIRRQRELLRKLGTASPFAGTGESATSYVSSDSAATLAAANAYTDSSSAKYGLEVSYSPVTVPAAATTPLPWGSPTENTGGYVVADNAISVPAGMGGVYAVTLSLGVADLQATRAFVSLYMGGSRGVVRGVFTSDTQAAVSAVARLADLDVVKAEVYCETATSTSAGWLTLYRLHS